MTIKLDNPQIENFFINELHSDVKAFSEFILKNLERYKQKDEFNVVHLDRKQHSYHCLASDTSFIEPKARRKRSIEILREKVWDIVVLKSKK